MHDVATMVYQVVSYLIAAQVVYFVPGRVAQSVGHLTCKSEVLGSIPGLATYCVLSFLPPLIQEGQLSVSGESICTKYWLTA